LTLYAVDKWEKVNGGADAGQPGAVVGESGCEAWDPIHGFAIFNKVTRSYKNRLIVLKGDSEKMAEKVPDGTLDFVFIDADHRYPAVVKDLAAWTPKLKAGGILCGHDIHFEGVKRAVDELIPNWEAVGIDHVWKCKKEDVKING